MASTTGVLYRATALKADASEDLYVRSLGFRPTKIAVKNRTNNTKVEWGAGYPEGTNEKTVAAGTRTEITSGVTPVDADANGNPGVKIPAGLADINDADGEDLVVECWGGAPALNP
jgi:hypothetical protein